MTNDADLHSSSATAGAATTSYAQAPARLCRAAAAKSLEQQPHISASDDNTVDSAETPVFRRRTRRGGRNLRRRRDRQLEAVPVLTLSQAWPVLLPTGQQVMLLQGTANCDEPHLADLFRRINVDRLSEELSESAASISDDTASELSCDTSASSACSDASAESSQSWSSGGSHTWESDSSPYSIASSGSERLDFALVDDLAGHLVAKAAGTPAAPWLAGGSLGHIIGSY